MLVKALTSFAGIVSMSAGEIKDITDEELAKDLLHAGYIEEVKEAKVVKPAAKKTAKTK